MRSHEIEITFQTRFKEDGIELQFEVFIQLKIKAMYVLNMAIYSNSAMCFQVSKSNKIQANQAPWFVLWHG